MVGITHSVIFESGLGFEEEGAGSLLYLRQLLGATGGTDSFIRTRGCLSELRLLCQHFLLQRSRLLMCLGRGLPHQTNNEKPIKIDEWL